VAAVSPAAASAATAKPIYLDTHYGPAGGTGTITYTDGTTQQYTATTADWYGNTPPPGGDLVATTTYIHHPLDPSRKAFGIYSSAITLQAGKTLQYVTLPSDGSARSDSAAMHIVPEHSRVSATGR
jgi:hypothetical protein